MEILNSNFSIGIFAESPLDKMLDWTELYFVHEQQMNKFAASSAQNARPRRPWPVRDLHFNELALAPFRAVFPDKNLRVVGIKMPALEVKVDIGAIESRIADLKIIYIIRNPVDTVASSIARRNATRRGQDFWHITTVDEGASEWMRAWSMALALRREMGGRVLFVKYEDLETRFDALKAKLASFLDVEPSFRTMFSPDLAARDLSPLNAEERATIEHRFGEIDRLWQEKSVSELMGLLPAVSSTGAARHSNSTDLLYYVPGNRLVFSTSGNSAKYQHHGFGRPEDWGTWVLGGDASLTLPTRVRWDAASLYIKFRVFSRRNGLPASCRVKVNGKEVGTLEPVPSVWGEEFEERIAVPSEALTANPITVSFEVTGARKLEEAPPNDPRPVGLGLVELALFEYATTNGT
jgi:hypothetical protein